MTITLPEEMRARIEARARMHGYSSVSEYILSLVEEEEGESEATAREVVNLTPRDRAELEARLDEGMASGPPIRATDAFWEERQRVLEERMAKRKVPAP